MPVSIRCKSADGGLWGTYRLSWETAREFAFFHLRLKAARATLTDDEGREEVWEMIDEKPTLTSSTNALEVVR